MSNGRPSEAELERARQLAVTYARIDGAEHKQYALIQIAKALHATLPFGVDPGVPA